jgi:hypothetical protein
MENDLENHLDEMCYDEVMSEYEVRSRAVSIREDLAPRIGSRAPTPYLE